MERLSYALKKLDWMNKLLLVVGFGLCIASIATGQGRYGLIWLVLMCSLVLSRYNNQQKQMMRRYGSLYFHMPDGEIYPVTLEQVRSEYAHGRKSRYNGRKVTIRFPYFCQDSSGALDTGFGLLIRADDRLKKPWKRGQLLAVTGYITAEGRDSFTIDRVEEIRLATAQEDLTVSASSPEQEDK